MASKNPPVKNAGFTFRISLFSQSTNLRLTSPTIAAGDFKVSTDGGTWANLGTTPSVSPASSGAVLVTLSAAEMNGDDVFVTWDDASGAEWWGGSVNIHPAAQTFDTIDTNVDSILADTGTDGVVLANNAITSAKIASGAITNAKFDAGAIDAAAIAANAIGASELAADAVAEIADAVWEEALADHSGTAGSTAELLQDMDNEVDEIHAQIDAIAVTGSQLNQIAESDTLTTGTESSGTYVDTNLANDTHHVITAASNEIDIYYQFDIGASGVPVSVSIEGYLKESAPAGGDTIALYAYDWVGADWDLIHSAAFTGIITDGPDQTVVHTLFARHVGTGGSDGLVRVRFQAASLEAGTTLNIDQIFVSFAESIAADVAAILADTNELQTDDVPGLIAALNDPTAAAIADAVWDEGLAGHVGAGSTGEALNNATAPSAASVADAVWDEALSGHVAAGSAGEALSSAGSGASAAEIGAALAAGLTDYEITPVNAMTSDGELNIYIGATLETTLSSLTIPAAWESMHLMVKHKKTQADSEARIYIIVTNGGDAGDGLQLLNGAAATAGNGSLTVDQPNGETDIYLADDATDDLVERNKAYFALKYFRNDGESFIAAEGICNIIRSAMVTANT